ncbi:hypothetical protein L227DRAFT_566416 [Lentinus tigrinus ALCF2SS1-6]|uniref:Uncharacterized protein n=1 Tax=Lentinus tigrinus ALCF2SS1-6 TaxID=1328759 RepID=A0A5C2RXX2_9APHY|nr:hypothetical protein L227DRAFT_566416 [Lentinus tigrinus ALCF2SS1-6]
MSTATLPTGNSDARYSTSAALAETEASTNTLSNQVQQNANQLHKVATDAAQTAEVKEPQAASAVDRLEENLSYKTNTAAAEGAADVQSAKATANGYVEQAKNLASSAITTAQSYIPGTRTSQTSSTTQANTTGSGVTATVQSAIATGKEYLTSAQATAKPYVESAAAAAKPYVDSAAAAAQPHFEKAKGAVLGSSSSTANSGSSVSGKPSEVPASTAPLESGPNVVGNPYPATVNSQATKVGEI